MKTSKYQTVGYELSVESHPNVENEILRRKINGRIRFTDDERRRLAKLGKELGRRALEDIGPIVKPDTIFSWYRNLIAAKFDSSKTRRSPGRPRTKPEIEQLKFYYRKAS